MKRTHQSFCQGAELMSKTIMLVHGAWVTTDCWTSFRDFLDSKGHRVVVPEWPYLDRQAEGTVEVPIRALQI